MQTTTKLLTADEALAAMDAIMAEQEAADADAGFLSMLLSPATAAECEAARQADQAAVDAAAARVAALEAAIADWSTRVYRANGATVRARSNDEWSGDTTAGAANERRRWARVRALQNELAEARQALAAAQRRLA